MRGVTKLAVLAATLVLPVSLTACSSGSGGTAGSPSAIKVGLITKFPVDFYDTMVDLSLIHI